MQVIEKLISLLLCKQRFALFFGSILRTKQYMLPATTGPRWSMQSPLAKRERS